MPVYQLHGTCNQCGACCTDGDLRCEFLKVLNPLAPIGAPYATICTAYARRTQGMPLRVLNPDGSVHHTSYCAKDTYEETLEIVKRGVGHGCSYRVELLQISPRELVTV